jgi:hypothetical protein
MNESQEEYISEDARQKFLNRLDMLRSELAEGCTPPKSASDLLNQYGKTCEYCGNVGLVNATCSCGALISFWDNPLYEMTFEEQTSEINPILSWKQTSIDMPAIDDWDSTSLVSSTEEEYENENESPTLDKQIQLLIEERDCLINQLQMCEDRIEDLQFQRKLHSNTVVTELVDSLDEFSRAVQILLSTGEYCDVNDLIGSYANTSVNNSPNTIRKQIIDAAKFDGAKSL